MASEQVLSFGEVQMRKIDAEDQLYFLSGKRLYVIGTMSGRYPPLGWRRPGFLVGKPLSMVGEAERPISAAHFLYEMGGVWAHPIKAIENLLYSIEVSGEEAWALLDGDLFVNRVAHVDFFHQRGDLLVRRRDFVVEDEPAFFSIIRLLNYGNQPKRLRLTLEVESNLMPSWFSGWPNGEDLLESLDGLVVATDMHWQDRWALVFGSQLQPTEVKLNLPGERGKAATLAYDLELGAGEELQVPFLYVVESLGGGAWARERFRRLISQPDSHLRSRHDRLTEAVFGNVRFSCSDRQAVEGFYNAKANLYQLQADLAPFLGKYYFAGLPEYVQLFGTDTAYSIPGICAAGQAEWAEQSLVQLARFAKQQCGRVPHEVTTNGRIFHPGNTQETPQFTIAAWHYFRWTGDLQFLAEIYPLCEEGVLDYLLAHWDADLDYYPDGNAMVEREGMGPEKLDSVVYFCRAIYCLAEMAGALGHHQQRERHLELASSLREAINKDFWLEEESLFADSLSDTHHGQMDGHWVVVTPMEVDIADRDKGARAMRRIKKDWINEYGLVHTRETEELVWTLPTGLMALASFAYGDPDLGWRLLANIAATTRSGSLGTFKELIPEGLCFMQLWSPAIFLQGVIEGLVGVVPYANRHYVELSPRLPSGWEFMRLEAVRFGGHELDVASQRRDRSERIAVTHRGASNLSVRLCVAAHPDASITTADGKQLAAMRDRRRPGMVWIDFELSPGETAVVTRSATSIIVAARVTTVPIVGISPG